MKTILSIAIALFVAGPALLAQQAGESATGGSDGFKWSWEEPAPETDAEPTAAKSAGIDPAAYDRAVNDNLKLRRENEELKKSWEEAQKINADLVAKLRSPQSAAAAMETGGAAVVGTNSADTTRKIEENSTLQAEVARLRNELETLQKKQGSGSATALVSKDSDLFKRVLQDNTALRAQLQRLKEARKESADARKALTDADKKWTEKVEEHRSRIKSLEEQNSALKKTLFDFEGKVRQSERSAEELARMRAEVEKRGRLLAEQELAVKRMEEEKTDRTSRIAQAEVEAEGFHREKTDILFNMGVLYTRTGMYGDAEEQFLSVLETEPTAADAHYNLGILYDKYLSNRDKAERHYKKFLELDPLGPDADKVKLWLLELEMEM